MSTGYVPHVDVLLRSLRITRERLMGRAKVAVDTDVLRALLELAVATLPFDPDFYAAQYPDIAQGRADDAIPDLHRHLVRQGYFEGRSGAPVPVDAEFYLALYPDVRDAIAAGTVSSAQDHYTGAGAAEGRIPSPELRDEVIRWNALLRTEARRP